MKLTAYGRENQLTDQRTGTEGFLDLEIVASLELFTNRSQFEPIDVDGIEESDIVEFEDDAGFIDFVSVADLMKTGLDTAKRSGDDNIVLNEMLVRSITGPQDYQRGLKLPKLSQFFKVKILRVPDKMARLTIKEITQMLEQKNMPNEGIYRCDNPMNLTRVDRIKASNEPILLLIHGTVGNTANSFGGFMQEGDRTIWSKMTEPYGSRVYAFEHKTLSKSPLQNAHELLQVIPRNTVLHLLSTSRGGMVGDILCRANIDSQDMIGFTDDEIAALEKQPGHKDDGRYAREITKMLKEKNIRVERFVRVACPATGTVLASKRLDLYFKIILNLIGKIPFLAGNPVYGFLKSFLTAVIKQKEDVAVLPGIEAMMPGSVFVNILNNPGLTMDSELVVIAGDVVPNSNFFRSIGTRLLDVFYLEQHDFIVNTKAMYGGIQRSREVYYFHQTQETNHFRYFRNQATQNAILIGLQGKASASPIFKPVVQEESKSIWDILRRNRSEDPHAPVAFLIPGIMGSRLRAGNKKIWAEKVRLFMGGMSDITIDADDVEAYDLMGSAYADFVEELSLTHRVIPFPYDWRRSILEAAEKLADQISAELESTSNPIYLIAHSMGGLVAHTVYNKHRDVWDTFIKREGSRLLFLGSPLRGSHIIPQVFLREEHFFKILHNIDIFHSQKELLQILTRYPGIAELLPAKTKGNAAEDGVNYFDKQVYEWMDASDTKFVQPTKTILKSAEMFSQMILSDPIPSKKVYYIAGQDDLTPSQLLIQKKQDTEERRFKLLGTRKGDGRVTWETGIPQNLIKAGQVWYMEATHGQLCNEPRYFPAIFEILRNGTTNKLPSKPPVERGEDKLVEMPVFEPEVMRDNASWESQLVGSGRLIEEVSDRAEPIRIEVTHGDLGNSRFPVCVGHHLGDGIVSAERVVNTYMEGRLSGYHAAGLYPGKLQTSLVVLNDHNHFEGAVIIGLGEFGKLTKGDFEKSFAHGLVDLAMKKCELRKLTRKDGEVCEKELLGVSTLLIGSRYGGLSLYESVMSIMTAVNEANKMIRAIGSCTVKQIGHVEIIELYEDIAISAARTIKDLLEDNRFRDFELADPILRKVSGRKQKISNVHLSDWWYRLRITESSTEGDEGARPIEFISITDKARTDVLVLPTQRKLVESLVEAAVNTARYDRSLAQTLYTLTIPNEFKDFAADKRDLVLQLDKKTAVIPWELLHDPSVSGKKPISIQGGMIRQLETRGIVNGMIRYVKQDTAFVLGNPVTEDLPDLPGALQEAKAVEVQLRNSGFIVTSSYEEKAMETVMKLFEYNYRVLHVAGHGVVDPDNPMMSGVVLSDGIKITPAEISQMAEVPEFVFVNCCYSGAMASRSQEQNRHILAANLGTEFIEKGVKAVVVAGWAVNDRAARTFAQELYAFMLDSLPFGEAVRRAREVVYENYGNTNTWGAYQCYGDQFFILRTGKRIAHTKPKSYVHPKEALIDVRNIRSSSDVRSSGEIEETIDKLNRLIINIPMAWITRTDISEALGSAFFELREFDKAAYYYNLLRKSDGDEFTLLGMRSLSNLYMKAALENFRTDIMTGRAVEKIRKQIEDAELLAEWLLKLGETRYRYALVGGNYKRKSLLIAGISNKRDESERLQERLDALLASRDAYFKAYTLKKDRTGRDDYYSLLNWLTIDELLFYFKIAPKVSKRSETQILVDDAREQRLGIIDSSPNFWDTVAKAAFLGYELFKYSDNSVKQREIIEEMLTIYSHAWKLGGSLRKSDNIFEHFRFVLETLESVPVENLSRARRTKLENTKQTFGNLRVGLISALGNYPEVKQTNVRSNRVFAKFKHSALQRFGKIGVEMNQDSRMTLEEFLEEAVHLMEEDQRLTDAEVQKAMGVLSSIIEGIDKAVWEKYLKEGVISRKQLGENLKSEVTIVYPFL